MKERVTVFVWGGRGARDAAFSLMFHVIKPAKPTEKKKKTQGGVTDRSKWSYFNPINGQKYVGN